MQQAAPALCKGTQAAPCQPVPCSMASLGKVCSVAQEPQRGRGGAAVTCAAAALSPATEALPMRLPDSTVRKCVLALGGSSCQQTHPAGSSGSQLRGMSARRKRQAAQWPVGARFQISCSKCRAKLFMHCPPVREQGGPLHLHLSPHCKGLQPHPWSHGR